MTMPRHVASPFSEWRRARRLGFSLLELILALSLSAVFLAALSTTIRLHLRAFEQGRSDVEEAQLARALLERMANDLRAAAGGRFSAPPGAPGGGLNNVSTAGDAFFRGDEQSLSLVVRKLRRYPAMSEIDDSQLPEPGDLRRVEYRVSGIFSGEAPRAQAAVDEPPGMIRDERSAPLHAARREDQTERAAHDGAANVSGSIAMGASPAAAPPRAKSANEPPNGVAPHGAEGLDEMRLEDSLEAVPEVVALRLRYFDGHWSPHWDCETRRGLPKAVEIVVALSDPGTAEALRTSGGLELFDSQGAASDAGPTAGEEAFEPVFQSVSGDPGPVWREYRLVVSLAPGGSQLPVESPVDARGPQTPDVPESATPARAVP